MVRLLLLAFSLSLCQLLTRFFRGCNQRQWTARRERTPFTIVASIEWFLEATVAQSHRAKSDARPGEPRKATLQTPDIGQRIRRHPPGMPATESRGLWLWPSRISHSPFAESQACCRFQRYCRLACKDCRGRRRLSTTGADPSALDACLEVEISGVGRCGLWHFHSQEAEQCAPHSKYRPESLRFSIEPSVELRERELQVAFPVLGRVSPAIHHFA